MKTKKYKIEIELLSDATFGSGESKNGVVNTEILLDKDGFPYMNAKTFKGILKNSFEEILSSYYIQNGISGNSFKKFINKLFGKSGQNLLQNNQLSVKFEDLVLSEKLRDAINNKLIKLNDDKDSVNVLVKDEFLLKKSNLFKKIDFSNLEELENNEVQINNVQINKDEIIMKSLTDIRFSTKIENGVSENNSLRAERVIRRGLKFETNIILYGDISEDEQEMFELGIKTLKHIGTKKSRGRGYVKTSIIEVKDSDLSLFNEIKDAEKKLNYIKFYIKNLQPLKLGVSQNPYDYEETKSYLSASSLRGAFISYIKSKRLENEDELIKRTINEVVFLDAYPVFNFKNEDYKKNNSYPFPLVYKTNKEVKRGICDEFIIPTEELKKDLENIFANNVLKIKTIGTLVNSMYLKTDLKEMGLDGDLMRNYKYSFENFEYIIEKDNSIIPFNINKKKNFHHKAYKKEDSNNKENIFRYSAIEKNNIFVSKLEFKNDVDNTEIEKLFREFLQEYIYIGGSKTSGYGKCEVISVENGYIDSEKEVENINCSKRTFEDFKSIFIYCVSDMSYLGVEEIKKILIEEFKELLPEEFEKQGFKRIYGRKTLVSGFNSKWGGKIALEEYIKRGSVIEVPFDSLAMKKLSEIEQDEIFNRLIKKIHDKSFGLRVNEGFGRVFINPEFISSKILNYINVDLNYAKEDNAKENDKRENITEDYDWVESEILSNLINVKLKEVFTNVLNTDFRNKNIASSQISKIYLLASNSNGISEFVFKFKRIFNLDEKLSQNVEKNKIKFLVMNLDIIEKEFFTSSSKKFNISNNLKLKDIIHNTSNYSNYKSEIVKKAEEILPSNSKVNGDEIIFKILLKTLYYMIRGIKENNNGKNK